MATLKGSWPMRRYLRHGMLPQLAAFEAVMCLGTATGAAHALCIAQPTLSGHLRKLGEALGVRLFERQGKRLVPTDAARALLPTVHEVFAAFERCEQSLSGVRTQAGSDWRGGCRPMPDGTAQIAPVRHDAAPTVAPLATTLAAGAFDIGL